MVVKLSLAIAVATVTVVIVVLAAPIIAALARLAWKTAVTQYNVALKILRGR